MLEQDTGVEPAFTAWEAVVLPIYESCGCVGIIAERHGNFNRFLSDYFSLFRFRSKMEIMLTTGRHRISKLNTRVLASVLPVM